MCWRKWESFIKKHRPAAGLKRHLPNIDMPNIDDSAAADKCTLVQEFLEKGKSGTISSYTLFTRP